MNDLTKKPCRGCEDENFPAFTPEQARDMMEHIPEWTLTEDTLAVEREFPFKDFTAALAFANKVGELAEQEWHHPDILVSWGRVKVTLTTHSIRGLSENDFIVAAKIDLIER